MCVCDCVHVCVHACMCAPFVHTCTRAQTSRVHLLVWVHTDMYTLSDCCNMNHSFITLWVPLFVLSAVKLFT